MSGFAVESKPFAALSLRELHDLLKLRCDVFVVEQRCAYAELDGRDPEAVHAQGRLDGELVACARWYTEGAAVRLGRVAVSPGHRGRGYGRRMVAAALEVLGEAPVQVHAQRYLEAFYTSFGFRVTGEPFDDHGVPHVPMQRA